MLRRGLLPMTELSLYRALTTWEKLGSSGRGTLNAMMSADSMGLPFATFLFNWRNISAPAS